MIKTPITKSIPKRALELLRTLFSAGLARERESSEEINEFEGASVHPTPSHEWEAEDEFLNTPAGSQ